MSGNQRVASKTRKRFRASASVLLCLGRALTSLLVALNPVLLALCSPAGAQQPKTNADRPPAYVDKILRDANPGDLPIEQPAKFEFIVNLKAANRIGLTIPPSVPARADQVIR